MKAALFYGPNDVKLEDIPKPQIGPDEVLIKVKVALTCGTDVKTFRRGHPVIIKSIPSSFGHELSGVIEEVGENVTNFSVGQRVVAANTAPCQKCYYCDIGEYNLCEDLEILNGAFSEYIKIPASIVKQNLLPIPDHVSFEEAAFTEPFANVLNGFEKTEIKPGQTVGVIGIGPIGLMFVKLAKFKGANVIAMGRNPLKLELAKTFGGADEVIDLTKTNDPINDILSYTKASKGFDVVIEAVGLPEVWEKSISLVRKGGTVHLFGGCKSGTSVKFDTRRLHYDQIKIISVFHHTPHYIKRSLKMISNGEIDFKPLITKSMPLDNVVDALKDHEAGKAIKIAIYP